MQNLSLKYWIPEIRLKNLYRPVQDFEVKVQFTNLPLVT